MTAEENSATYGKCNNPHGHGHNYVLEVTVSGQVDESTGMVCDLVDLDECVQREIVTRFDLENLNMRPEFADSVPTTENLCTVIYDIVKREREGLLRTPERVHKAFEFLTRGYNEDPEAMLKKALFTVTYDEMVIVKDVEVFSLCEHHMLPFFGKVHVAYIPNGKVIGLSKIPRLIEIFSLRLQIQERLTTQIADTIQKVIQPQCVRVVIEARHLCMTMRGVEKQHSQDRKSTRLNSS